jgi:hypothetical protein
LDRPNKRKSRNNYQPSTKSSAELHRMLNKIDTELIVKDFVGEYLQQVINYKHAGNVDKALETSLEVLKINSSSLDGLYHAASAYFVKNDPESITNANNLLESKFNMLGSREKHY